MAPLQPADVLAQCRLALGKRACTEPGRLKALVVDDLPVNRLILGTILTKLGFEVLEAENGLQCIEVYREERTQLVCIFLDLQMPVADGYVATAGIRALESHSRANCRGDNCTGTAPARVPVVLCTASSLDDVADGAGGLTVAQHAVALGADGAVRKPLTPLAVQRVLDTFAPGWRAGQSASTAAATAAPAAAAQQQRQLPSATDVADAPAAGKCSTLFAGAASIPVLRSPWTSTTGACPGGCGAACSCSCGPEGHTHGAASHAAAGAQPAQRALYLPLYSTTCLAAARPRLPVEAPATATVPWADELPAPGSGAPAAWHPAIVPIAADMASLTRVGYSSRDLCGCGQTARQHHRMLQRRRSCDMQVPPPWAARAPSPRALRQAVTASAQ